MGEGERERRVGKKMHKNINSHHTGVFKSALFW